MIPPFYIYIILSKVLAKKGGEGGKERLLQKVFLPPCIYT